MISGQKKETYLEKNIQSTVGRACPHFLRGKLPPAVRWTAAKLWACSWKTWLMTTFYSTNLCRLEPPRLSHAGGTNSSEFHSDRKSLIISGSPLLILRWKLRPPVAVEIPRIEVGYNLHLLSNHGYHSSRTVARSLWRYYPQNRSSLLKVLLERRCEPQFEWKTVYFDVPVRKDV